MNKILVGLLYHTYNRILGLLSVMLTVSVGLVLVFSTLQVENYLTSAEAQIANNTIGGTFGYNNNRTSAISENSTLDPGRNVTVQDLTLPELFERVEKSVVQVTTTSGSDQLDLFRSGIGSGFVYNNDGLIVTNYHVIAPSVLSSESVRGETNNGVDINVAFEDGTIYPATLVGADRFSDIAIIDVPEDATDRLVPLPIGNSSELRVGQQVVAIGNPFGFSGSMTEGIVSGLGRLIPSSEEDQLPPLPYGIPIPPPQDPSIPGLPQQPPGDEPPPSLPPTNPDEELRETQRRGSFSIPDVIQTDAPINPGNSGGPLLDLRGEVIGMNTAIISNGRAEGNIGIGFAVPINTVRELLPQLHTGKVIRGRIGVTVAPVPAGSHEEFGLKSRVGAIVGAVAGGGAADKAG